MNSPYSIKLFALAAILTVISVAASGKAPYKSLYFSDAANIATDSPWYDINSSIFLDPAFLRHGVDEAADGGADVFLIEPGLCWVPLWNGNFIPIADQYSWYRAWSGNPTADNTFLRFAFQGGDFIQPILDRARAKGMAAFISFRLNDGNNKMQLTKPPYEPPGPGDRVSIDHIPQFYVDNSQYRLPPDDDLGRGAEYAKFLQDWSHPEVREWRLCMIKELCDNYDMDGLNIDFMRDAYFFPRDPAVSDADRVAIMVDFLRKVRQCLDESHPSSPRKWLCVRIPSYLSNFGQMGVDPVAFKEAGVDMFILSTSYEFEQQTEAASIRQLVPDRAMYYELTHTPQAAGWYTKKFRRATDSQLYTTANLAYRWGMDGMAFFNFQYYRNNSRANTPDLGPWCEPPFRALDKVRDPVWLARQPQEYFWVTTRSWPAYRDRTFLPLGDSYGGIKCIMQPGQVEPLVLTMKLSKPTTGWSTEGRLRLEMGAVLRTPTDTWQYTMGADNIFSATLNDHPLTPCDESENVEFLPNPNSTVLVAGSDMARAWKVPVEYLNEISDTDGDGVVEAEVKIKYKSGSLYQTFPVFMSLAIGTGQTGTFEVSCDSKTRSVISGKSISWDVNTSMADGIFNGVVTFNASGLPGGTTASFSNANVTGPKTGASTITINTTGATPPGLYTIAIQGECEGATKTTVVALQVHANTAPPAAPTGLTVAGVGHGQVSLAWNTVEGATGYNIKCSRMPRPAQGNYRQGIEYQWVADTTDTNIIIPWLAGEADYYLFITAVNAGGESPPTPQVLAHTLSIAGMPPAILTNLVPVVIGSGAVPAVLEAFVDGVPTPAIHWQVSTDGGEHWENAVDGDIYEGARSVSLKIKGITAGMAGYLYRYVATNSNGSVTVEGAARLVMADCFQSPTGVIVDGNDNIYITDAALHAVYKMDTHGNVAVMAGSAAARGYVDGQGASARFSGPAGVKINPMTGILHVADMGNRAVRTLNASGMVGTLSAGLDMPTGIAMDSEGNTYVADTDNHAIRKITPSGTMILLAGSGDPANSGITEATGTMARFNHPTGIAVDADHYIYVADTGNHTIRYIRPSDNYVGTLAGVPGVPGCADGDEENAHFRSPYGLAVDGVLMSRVADGSLYVADTGNSLIREVTRGCVRTIAGYPGIDEEPAIVGVPGFRDGTGTSAWFRYPEDIALTKEGALVVADTGNGLLRKVSFDHEDNAVVTAIIPAVAGTGGGDGGGDASGGSSGGALSWLHAVLFVGLICIRVRKF
jgi:sugar lactone lactonase YvrE